MILLFSACAVVLGLMALDPSVKIFRRWRKADQEERYDLEKESYLTLTVVYIIIAIRMFTVPLYFWTMQSLVPMIPGAMCMWGVFNVLPDLCWPALALKFFFPVMYGGWLVLALVNNSCKKNQLMKNLMGFFILAVPLLVADSLVDLAVFLKLEPVYVSCCTSAIDVAARPIPIAIGGINGQVLLLAAFLGMCCIYAITVFMCLRHRRLEWVPLALSIMLIPLSVLAMTEVLTPWILRTPFHHCPFCLLMHAPGTTLLMVSFWYALAAPWWVLLTRKLAHAQTDKESEILKTSRLNMIETLWMTSGYGAMIGLAVIVVHLMVALV